MLPNLFSILSSLSKGVPVNATKAARGNNDHPRQAVNKAHDVGNAFTRALCVLYLHLFGKVKAVFLRGFPVNNFYGGVAFLPSTTWVTPTLNVNLEIGDVFSHWFSLQVGRAKRQCWLAHLRLH